MSVNEYHFFNQGENNLIWPQYVFCPKAPDLTRARHVLGSSGPKGHVDPSFTKGCMLQMYKDTASYQHDVYSSRYLSELSLLFMSSR